MTIEWLSPEELTKREERDRLRSLTSSVESEDSERDLKERIEVVFARNAKDKDGKTIRGYAQGGTVIGTRGQFPALSSSQYNIMETHKALNPTNYKEGTFKESEVTQALGTPQGRHQPFVQYGQTTTTSTQPQSTTTSSERTIDQSTLKGYLAPGSQITTYSVRDFLVKVSRLRVKERGLKIREGLVFSRYVESSRKKDLNSYF